MLLSTILGAVVDANCHPRVQYTNSSLRSRRQVDLMAKTQPQLTDLPDQVRQTEENASRKAGGTRYASTGVVPALDVQPLVGPSQELCTPHDGDQYPLSFWQAFGLLGLPILLLLGICIGWTMWLILLTLAPNATANFLMNTSAYDNGMFWLIIEDGPAMKAASLVGLIAIELFYVYLLAKALVWRTKEVPIVKYFSEQYSAVMRRNRARVQSTGAAKIKRNTWAELTGIHGRYRKFWNLLLKAIDLIVEVIALRGFMNDGFPPVLIYGWAGFISVNSLSCAINILVSKHSALTEIIVDSVFDLVAAVVYPILILWYCHHNFAYDHSVTELYSRVMHPNGYDNMGRIFANQADMALFRVSFDSLRIQTVLDLFLRISMNLSFCSRFRAVLDALVRIHRRVRYPRRPTAFRVRPVTQVPKLTALLFLGFSGLVIAYSHIAIKAAWSACSPHPECVVYVQRFPWTASVYEFCPCQVMVDENLYIVVWEQWEHPADVTDKVKVLAAAGQLRLLRLINRQLLALPDELRGCKNMKHLSLVHTMTETIPAWAKEWSQLEYIHIDGYPGGPGLTSLPSDFFEDMPSLALLYLSDHSTLATLPAFSGVPNMREVVLASIPQLQELPVIFDNMSGIVKLVLFDVPQLKSLPDMSPLSTLKEFAVIKPSHLCCNGFLGSCDQSSSFCAVDQERNIPTAACLESSRSASVATRALFRKFDDTTCYKAAYLSGIADPPTRERTDECEYTFFRRCEYPPNSGQFGMCMPYRMRVLSCTLNPDFITFRRMEIKELKMPCNPAVEDWLGCPAPTLPQ